MQNQLMTVETGESPILKLTPRSHHATMAMVELARHQGETPIALGEIAARGNISLSYLEQLFAGLRRQGLVKSTRGPGGGYRLARSVDNITIADIFNAAEDSVPARRLQGSNEPRDNSPETLHLWDYIGHVLYNRLSSITLKDVMTKELEL